MKPSTCYHQPLKKKKIPSPLRPEMLKKKIYNRIWNGIKSLKLLLRSLPPPPLHQIITAFNYQRRGCLFLQHERGWSRLRQHGRDVTLSYFWHFRGKNVQRARCDSTSVILQRTGVATARTTSRWYRRGESEPRKRSPPILLITTDYFFFFAPERLFRGAGERVGPTTERHRTEKQGTHPGRLFQQRHGNRSCFSPLPGRGQTTG